MVLPMPIFKKGPGSSVVIGQVGKHKLIFKTQFDSIIYPHHLPNMSLDIISSVTFILLCDPGLTIRKINPLVTLDPVELFRQFEISAVDLMLLLPFLLVLLAAPDHAPALLALQHPPGL